MVSPTSDRRFGLLGSRALKIPVTAVAVANITLSGEQTVDGRACVASNAASVADRVLCVAQTDSTQNGIYDVSASAWTRSLDADNIQDICKGTMVFVNYGTVYRGVYWRITTDDPITVGTTGMAWELVFGSFPAGGEHEQSFTGVGPYVLAGTVGTVTKVFVNGIKYRLSDFSVVGNTVSYIGTVAFDVTTRVDICYV
jgi:hypothetical protein